MRQQRQPRRRICCQPRLRYFLGAVLLTIWIFCSTWLHQRLSNDTGTRHDTDPLGRPSVSDAALQKPNKLTRMHLQPQPQSGSASTPDSSIRLLILMISVQRNPEMVCTTIQSIKMVQWSTMDSSTTMMVAVPIVILLHRYGPWTCPPSSPSPGQEETVLIHRRDFAAHERVSNHQQTMDYITLIQDGLGLVRQQGRVTKSHPNFTHSLFLDDDVELCSDIFTTISLIVQQEEVQNNTALTLAHLGRGSSGILIPFQHLPKLPGVIARTKKNVDKAMLEWALQNQMGCTVRPTMIQMRHIGLQSRLRTGQTWDDIDQCGRPANNRDWQALSESRFHPALFSEYCMYPFRCYPYGGKWTGTHCDCAEEYAGDDCGVPRSMVDSYVRRKNNAPIVVLLSGSSTTGRQSLQTRVVSDAQSHGLVNLYVIGNQHQQKWLTDHIYTSTLDARDALDAELKDSSRYGAMAFSKELIVLEQLLSSEDLWKIKYYEVKAE